MNIPGTHDSAAYCMNRISFKCAKTQDLTIKEQLEIGIRDFDIRIFQAHEDTSQDEDIICCHGIDIRIFQAHEDTSQDEDIICCHGICDCYVSPNFCDNRKLTYKSVLLDVKNFLEKNPTEAVLFSTFLGRGKWKKGYMLIRAYHLFDKYVGDISIRYRPDLLMGDVRGKIINYTTLIEEFDARENMIVTKTRNIMASTVI